MPIACVPPVDISCWPPPTAPIIVAMSDIATAADTGGATSPKRSRVPRVIAVDGSAASGKSTIGRRLAARLGYPFLDTGIMYRAITYAALQRGTGLSDDGALARLASL